MPLTSGCRRYLPLTSLCPCPPHLGLQAVAAPLTNGRLSTFPRSPTDTDIAYLVPQLRLQNSLPAPLTSGCRLYLPLTSLCPCPQLQAVATPLTRGRLPAPPHLHTVKYGLPCPLC